MVMNKTNLLFPHTHSLKKNSVASHSEEAEGLFSIVYVRVWSMSGGFHSLGL